MKAEGDAAPLLQRLLQAARTKSADLVTQLDPAWVDAAWKRTGAAAAGLASRVPRERQSALLAEAFGLRWPPLAAFRQPAHRIALLGRPQILKVLAAAALQLRRDSVRRTVGRQVQGLLVQHIGEPAYHALLASPAQGLSEVQALQVHELDVDLLAAAGYRSLCAQGVWQCRRSLAITRMSLAPAALRDAATHARPSDAGADGIVDQLQNYFPELSWLFGSDMDRALSA